MSETQPLTFGQRAVGLKFNPSNDDKVGQLKQKHAEIIDLIMEIQAENGQEDYLEGVVRGEAIRTAMDSQMWAVKYASIRF